MDILLAGGACYGLILAGVALDYIREIRDHLKATRIATEHAASCAAELLNLQQARHLDGR